MELPNLPIVERELRVSARRAMTYWGRAGYGLLGILLISWALWLRGMGVAGGPAVGRPAFLMLAYMALFAAVVTALRLTAPSIATEKREGTLGLLFLTDLKPRDVVFGKLAVTSLETLFRFLALVPVLAIPIMIGGVTAGDFGRLVVVLLNSMFLAAAIGMFASCLSPDEKNASGFSTTLVIIVAAAPPLLALGADYVELPPAVSRTMQILGPAHAWFCFTNTLRAPQGFWVSILASHALGWLLLWGTCRLLPRVWQDRPATATQEKRRARTRDFAQGDTEERRARRTALLELSPLLWLNARDRFARHYPWILLAAAGGLLIWIEWKWDVPWRERGFVLGATWVLHLIFKTWIGSLSSASLSADRDCGALELLLSTPMTTRDIVRGHWLGLQHHFARPLAFLLALEAVWVLAVLAFGRDEGERHLLTWLFIFGCHYAVFFMDVWALGWLGLWMGVKAKNAQEAASGTQLRVLILPWVALALSMMAVGCLFRFQGFGDPLAWTVFIWTGWSLTLDIAWMHYAREKVHASLRDAALERYARPPGAPPGWATALGRRLAHLWAGRR